MDGMDESDLSDCDVFLNNRTPRDSDQIQQYASKMQVSPLAVKRTACFGCGGPPSWGALLFKVVLWHYNVTSSCVIRNKTRCCLLSTMHIFLKIYWVSWPKWQHSICLQAPFPLQRSLYVFMLTKTYHPEVTGITDEGYSIFLQFGWNEKTMNY